MANIFLNISEDDQVKNKVIELEKSIEKETGKNLHKFIYGIIDKCFEEENINEKVLVNIEIVSDEEIQQYNDKYREMDKVTDVLSFPMYERQEIWSGECEIFTETEMPVMLGDIVLNLFQIERQAEEYATGIVRETAYMIVHSFYHLMGHDHMIEEEKKIMRQKEEKILRKLGYVCN